MKRTVIHYQPYDNPHTGRPSYSTVAAVLDTDDISRATPVDNPVQNVFARGAALPCVLVTFKSGGEPWIVRGTPQDFADPDPLRLYAWEPEFGNDYLVLARNAEHARDLAGIDGAIPPKLAAQEPRLVTEPEVFVLRDLPY